MESFLTANNLAILDYYIIANLHTGLQYSTNLVSNLETYRDIRSKSPWLTAITLNQGFFKHMAHSVELLCSLPKLFYRWNLWFHLGGSRVVERAHY